MTATPPRADLRTLAAVVAKDRAKRWGYTETLGPVELANYVHRQAHDANLLADLAAVLPEHQRLVLDEAVEDLRGAAKAIGALDPDDLAAFGIRYAIAELQRLAAAAQPAGLSAPVPAGTAPAVPEEADGQRAGTSGYVPLSLDSRTHRVEHGRVISRPTGQRAGEGDALDQLVAERDRLGDKANQLVQALTEARAELNELRGQRILSVVFAHHKDAPRPFALYRRSDVTGVSGTGIVAEGAAFSDGTAVLRWLSEWPTSVVFHDRGIEAIEAIHGHGGATQIVWLSDELEPLAEMETQRDEARADRDRLAAHLAHYHDRPATPDDPGEVRRRLARATAERDVIRAARAWRDAKNTVDIGETTAELIAAVDALSDAGTDQTEDDHG